MGEFKAGDKVFRAMLNYKGVEVQETTVKSTQQGGEMLRLEDRELAWHCKVLVPAVDMSATPEDAVKALVTELERRATELEEKAEEFWKKARFVTAHIMT